MEKPRVSRKKISSKLAYENPFFKVWEDDVTKPTGSLGKYYWVQTHPAVFVLPITEKKEVYLIGQYRYPVREYCLEVVAGSTDGGQPLAAAKRELWEETGLTARHWKKVGQFCPWNGVASEVNYIYLARGLVQTNSNKRAEEGIDQVIKVPFKKALEMVKNGQIKDGQSIGALALAALHLKIIK